MMEEIENIKYGNLETAMEYCKRNRTEEWIQQFLRCDGHNVALADGLLIEERFYTGIVQYDITLLHNIKEGDPEYLSKKDDIDYFFSIVDEMVESTAYWNPPPLIIEFRSDNGFYVCDGRHRLEMFRQKNVKAIPAIVWTTGKDDYEKLKEIIKC